MSAFVLGVTGGIASGKSTVMKLLARQGIATISSDELAHRCLRKGTKVYRAIWKRFGNDVLDKNGKVIRRKLGEIVFSNPVKRKALERIVHPCVIKGLKQFMQSHRGIVALDIPLLFEAKLSRLVDKSVVVYCRPNQQLMRIRRRDRLSRREAVARMKAQMPLAKKRERADFVISNTSRISALLPQVLKLKAKIIS
jgi:dephospho-CoA kinase